jgi:hypothetical protein
VGLQKLRLLLLPLTTGRQAKIAAFLEVAGAINNL